jgi:hypothetical protein
MFLTFAAAFVGTFPFVQKFAPVAQADVAGDQCAVAEAEAAERTNPNRILFISCGGFL